MKLKCPVNLTDEVNTACLPDRSDAYLPTGTDCVTAGWGTTMASTGKFRIGKDAKVKVNQSCFTERGASQQSHADKVRHVEVPVVDKMQCQLAYAPYRKLLEITRSAESICASNMDGKLHYRVKLTFTIGIKQISERSLQISTFLALMLVI